MSMFNVHRKELDWGGRKLVLETGKVARQADGAIMATYGDTSVLCTAVGARSPKPGIDFFPLTINYQEKTSAAGKIPGGFFKREGRPTEKETLTSRLIDRPIRPLFHSSYRNETQVVCTVLSHDLKNDPDIVAMIGASAALTISGIPFMGPVGGARVGYVDGKYVLNPYMEDVTDSALDLVLAGTREGVLMVESEAKELPEETMLGAVTFGHEHMQPVIQAIIQLAEMCAKEPFTLTPEPEAVAVVKGKFEAFAGELAEAYKNPIKQERYAAVDAVKEKAVESLGESEDEVAVASGVLKKMESAVVRGNILRTGVRIDGRETA
ncbi:MAG TPA: polyribonucleotide nucleotidyltransferase, partial [Rhodospirillaceae bacterium]|nr:polyribonucleotide nucleotidyltransferase [Rhodospirillaceae bacterium]